MERVIAYVDGFNLYFGLREAKLKRYYWLDVSLLAKNLLKPQQHLVATHYFTARIQDTGNNGPDRKRQNDYLEALTLVGVSCHFGHYLQKAQRCRKCGASWPYYEEKMTDVNIATQMLLDACDDLFDVALIVSGDSDLSTPIQRVRSRFPNKRVIVAFPPGRSSEQLKKHASGYLHIGKDKLRKSQLPDRLTKPDGHVLVRPSTWR